MVRITQQTVPLSAALWLTIIEVRLISQEPFDHVLFMPNFALITSFVVKIKISLGIL